MKSYSSRNEVNKLISQLRGKSDYFEEYTVLLFSFIQKLQIKLIEEHAKSVVFLSREGYFLKILFDRYQEIRVTPEQRIVSKYFKCSRHALQGLIPELRQADLFENISLHDYLNILGFEDEEIEQLPLSSLNVNTVISGRLSASDEYRVFSDNIPLQALIKSRFSENTMAFQAYAQEIFNDDKIYLCDIGYFGTMQNYLQRLLHKDITGFYIGRIGNLNVCDPNTDRKFGLIYECDIKLKTDSLCKILRSNMLIVEMLLYAPHGSVQRYCIESGQAKTVEAWKTKEKKLYFSYIEKLQSKILDEFTQICCSNLLKASESVNAISASLAKMTLRDGLLPNIRQIKFLIKLQEAMCSNYWKDSRHLKFRVRDTKINLRQLLIAPEDYVHYMVKFPVWFYKRKLILLYYPFGFALYMFYSARNRLL